MIAAVAGVHPAITEARATHEQLVVGDLLECEGWVCEGGPEYAVARVVDADGRKLNDFCVDCLGVGAGWWCRSRPRVSVWWPADGDYPAQTAVA